MKKIVSTVFVAAVLLGIGVTLVGCGPTTTPPAVPPKTGTDATSTPPKDKPMTAEGKFVSYKEDKLTIMVGEKETPFDVKNITPKSDGKEIKWDDFKKDDKVTVITEKDKVKSVEKAK